MIAREKVEPLAYSIYMNSMFFGHMGFNGEHEQSYIPPLQCEVGAIGIVVKPAKTVVLPPNFRMGATKDNLLVHSLETVGVVLIGSREAPLIARWGLTALRTASLS